MIDYLTCPSCEGSGRHGPNLPEGTCRRCKGDRVIPLDPPTPERFGRGQIERITLNPAKAEAAVQGLQARVDKLALAGYEDDFADDDSDGGT